MRRRRISILALALAALSLPALADNVGKPLPHAELEGFTQSKSFEDYLGRAVLIEYFAFW
jgi:hypothetical protein